MLNAGRELDALIAEKVMGMVLPDTLLLRPSEIPLEEATQIILPAYSTSIADAWTVIEKLQGTKDCCHDTLLAGGVEKTQHGYECLLTGVEGEWCKTADTAPLAICLTALEAVGYEVTR